MDEKVTTFKDEIAFKKNEILFYHANKSSPSIFDKTVHEQGLDSVKDQLFNPLKNLVFGGLVEGTGMKPASTLQGTYTNTDFKGWKLKSIKPSRSQQINIYLHTQKADEESEWEASLRKIKAKNRNDRKN